jgi:HEAT repeat protein
MRFLRRLEPARYGHRVRVTARSLPLPFFSAGGWPHGRYNRGANIGPAGNVSGRETSRRAAAINRTKKGSVMGRPLRWVVLLGVGTLMTGSTLLLVGPGQAGDNGGREVADLIKQLEGSDRISCEAVVRALGELGPKAKDAVPALLAKLEVVWTVPDGRMGPPRYLAVPIAKALWRIDPQGKQVAPALVQALFKKDPALFQGKHPSSNPFLLALDRIGPEAVPAAVPALVAKLKGPDDEVRDMAVAGLAAIGPRAEEAVGPLADMLKDPNALRRLGAVTALGELIPTSRKAIPALLARLEDEDPKVRAKAASVLGGLGPEPKAAVPALLRCAKDPEADVRLAAVYALGAMGPEAKAAVPLLLERFQDRALDVHARLGAAYALGHIDPRAAAPALIKGLSDPHPAVHQQSCKVLGEIGPVTKEVVPALVGALRPKKNFGHLPTLAAEALGRMGPAAEGAVGPLTELLKNPADAERCLRAAEALGRIGVGPRTAVPALAKALETKETRIFVADALGRFGREAREAVPVLTKALQEKDDVSRAYMALALWRIEGKAEVSVAALIELTKDRSQPYYYLRKPAEFLGAIGPPARAAVPRLREMLKEEDPAVRASAALALWQIDGEAEAALPALVAALKDDDPRTRQHAAWALGVVGPGAKAVTPPLKELLLDKEAAVRHAAAEALAKIERPAEKPRDGGP